MDIGDAVPDFESVTDQGKRVTLSSLLEDGPIVLFFYPKAETPGCTVEACHFRDLASEFAEAGAQRIGISRDSIAEQRAFAEKHSFDYPLLSDESGDIAAIFGAKRMGPLWSKRQTFVIGADQTLLGAINSETDMEVHADEALAILRKA